MSCQACREKPVLPEMLISPSKVEEGPTRAILWEHGNVSNTDWTNQKSVQTTVKLENAFIIRSTQYKSDTIHKKM